MTMFMAALAVAMQAEPAAQGMTPAAWVFMLVAWGLVIWLNLFSFTRIFSTKTHFDPDGVGPDHSPTPPTREEG